MEHDIKALSCGIIIYNEKYLLGCVPYGKKNMLDIPKGALEEGESPIDCTIRETYEETGLRLHKNQLKDLGLFNYNKNKDLYLFSCKIDFDINKLYCNSMFEFYGKTVPEMIGYKQIEIDNYYEIEMFFYQPLSKLIIPLLKGNKL